MYEGQDKNPEMCRVLLTHEVMCRFVNVTFPTHNYSCNQHWNYVVKKNLLSISYCKSYFTRRHNGSKGIHPPCKATTLVA